MKTKKERKRPRQDFLINAIHFMEEQSKVAKDAETAGWFEAIAAELEISLNRLQDDGDSQFRYHSNR